MPPSNTPAPMGARKYLQWWPVAMFVVMTITTSAGNAWQVINNKDNIADNSVDIRELKAIQTQQAITEVNIQHIQKDMEALDDNVKGLSQDMKSADDKMDLILQQLYRITPP